MIRLVALDLDGTLVNEQLVVSQTTIDVLRRIQVEKGVKVVLATGRMFPSTVAFAHKLGVMGPVISYQGAMIRDVMQPLDDIRDHPMLFHQTLDIAVSQAIVEMIDAEGWHANVYVNDRLFTTQFNPYSHFYSHISGVVPQEVPQLKAILTAPASKIMIIDDQAEAIVERLKALYPATISVCRSRHNFCEIVHADVSKWQAIQALLKKWNILPEEVLAIGDQENDLSMITQAGVGVAMGNAPDHVKAMANYVTDTLENDGAAKAIEKFVYGHFPLQDTAPNDAHRSRV